MVGIDGDEGRDEDRGVDAFSALAGSAAPAGVPTVSSSPSDVSPSPRAAFVSASEPFANGDVIKLTNLNSAPHMMGEMGKLVTFDENRGRWVVQLQRTGEYIRVKENNLEKH